MQEQRCLYECFFERLERPTSFWKKDKSILGLGLDTLQHLVQRCCNNEKPGYEASVEAGKPDKGSNVPDTLGLGPIGNGSNAILFHCNATCSKDKS